MANNQFKGNPILKKWSSLVKLKEVTTIMLLILFFSPKLTAQINFNCGTAKGASTASSSSQPTNCIQLLNDFAPKSADRELEVKVNFIVFVPSTNSTTSEWFMDSSNPLGTAITPTPTSQSDATLCLAKANSIFSNTVAPKLTGTGASTVTGSTKIKLVLGTFGYTVDNTSYADIEQARTNLAYNDPNAINVFLGAMVTTTSIATNTVASPNYTYVLTEINDNINSAAVVGTGTNNTIIFHRNHEPYHEGTGANLLKGWSNIRDFGIVLAHEVSHQLGLDHTDYDPVNTAIPPAPSNTYISISSILPAVGCCTNVLVNDFVYELPPTATSACSTTGASNNLMSTDAGCNRYLSPQQAAVMNYNLRTVLKNFLTSSGYTAATVANSSFDYDVTADETWTTDRYFKGNITVKSGKTLNISCAVGMTHGAKIIIESTGQLVVNGGTVTNISGRTWDGIWIEGTPGQSQFQSNGSNPGGVLYHGMLRIKNGGTLSHANTAVTTKKSSFTDAGGIIIATNANFINNRVDVDLSSYNSNSYAFYPSASRFYNSTFITTDEIGDSKVPYTHINMSRIYGVGIYGCTFQYTANPLTAHGNGIMSSNASYNVDKYSTTPTVFNNLLVGIEANNMNPLTIPSISNCKFIDNGFHAAHFLNSNTLAFQTNTVQFNQTYSSGYAGVYLHYCKNYKIKNNSFVTPGTNAASDIGIAAYKSEAGSHEIYRNIFSHLYIGINAIDNNSGSSNVINGLKMNCNDFSQSINTRDIALTYSIVPPSVMTKQGETYIPYSTSTNLVRNIYGASCSGTVQNKWYIDGSSTKQVLHGSNSQAATQPTPQPACSRTIVSVVNTGISLNYTADCTASPSSSGGGGTTQSQRLSNMNGYITDLKTDNTDDVHHFEIESTVSSKLNCFLTDTAFGGMDSVIAILSTNQGNMADADIQLVFAYMAIGDYESATTKVNAMSGGRSDWADLLAKLIEIEQQDNGIFSLNENTTNRDYLRDNFANMEGKDGQPIAQAILKACCDIEYTEPQTYPEGTPGARIAQPQNQSNEQIVMGVNGERMEIKVYPNPTKTGVNIYYNGGNNSPVKIEVRDLLGKVIFTKFIMTNLSESYVPMNELENGMYLITLSKNKEVVYKTKIIKED